MQDEVVIVVAGGEPPRPEAVLEVPLGAPVIAADGGLEHARALGLEVTAVIGDLDSVTGEALDEATASGTRVVRHPEEKDATDLELALDAALELGASRILVLAGEGGRLDHLLSSLLLLGSTRYAHVQVDAAIGRARAHVIRDARVLSGEPGELLSLLALHGRAEGVSTEGLVYPLAGETLGAGSSRGVSNVFASDTASVRLERGVLLALRPGLEEESAK
jgi:thiamine pyrophosphokinase